MYGTCYRTIQTSCAAFRSHNINSFIKKKTPPVREPGKAGPASESAGERLCGRQKLNDIWEHETIFEEIAIFTKAFRLQCL